MSFLQEAITKAILGSLSAYIAHFKEDQVKVGLWAGDLVLEDVELKCSAFNTYDSAVHIAHGCIQRIRIQVPWTSFWRNPIQVDISGVDCELHLRGTYDVLDELQQKNLLVQCLLANARASIAKSSEGWSLFSGLSGSILHRLVRNIAVHLDDVNVYHAMAQTTVGVTLQSLTFCDDVTNTTDNVTKTTAKVLDITDLGMYATVGDASLELLAPFQLHVRLTQEEATDDSMQCALTARATFIDMRIPLALAPYLEKMSQTCAMFASGRKLKCLRWLALYGRTPRNPWRYAKQALFHSSDASASSVVKGCYTTLYTKWLDSSQSSVAFMHQLNWLELQLGVQDILEAQVEATGLATSTKGKGRPVRMITSPKQSHQPFVLRWGTLNGTWDVAGMTLAVATCPFDGSIALQQLHGQFLVDSSNELVHHRVEIDSIDVTWQRDSTCVFRLHQPQPLTDGDNNMTPTTGISVQWRRGCSEDCSTDETSAMDIALSSVHIECNVVLPWAELWPQPHHNFILLISSACKVRSTNTQLSNRLVSCSIQNTTMQLQLDDTWAIIATSTDLYVKLHPHHLYQLRTSSFALATTQNQTTHHMPIAGVEAFALCATDAAESKSMQVDVASIKLHVSLQLIHVALRFAAFVLSVPAVSPESVSPRLSSWGDGCIVAATMRCSLVEVWILPPTEKISGVVAGVASNNPPTAFALATLNQATMEGLWQHQAVQHARAAVSQVFLSIDQTTVVQIAPTPTTPQGVTLLLRQSASLDSAFSVHTICGVLDIVYPPEALCQGITHAKTYVDLLRRNTSSLPFTSISNRTPSEGTPQLQAPHPPTTAPPSLPWRLTLDWQMDLVTVLLCQHKKPFVKYHFYNMAVQAKMLQASTSPCLSSSTFVDLTVYRMYLQDLTDTGVALHRDVVVPTQCTCCRRDTSTSDLSTGCHVISFTNHPKNQTGNDISKQQPTWTLHGLQVTCLWRLYIELWNYMYHPSGGVELVTTHYRRTFSRTYDNVERSSIRVVFDHVAFCFPRNGTSIDMLAMVMNECVFTKSFGTDTWTYDQAMGTTTEATLSVDNIDQPLPTDGDRQKNCLAMTQVSLYCADTESVVQRHWSFRRGTHSPEVPPHSPPTNMESLLPPLPPPLASIIEGGPMYLDPNIAWKRVTVAPFDFTFVRDFGLDECSIMQTRDLFVIQPSLRLNLELTELSILLSLWYDNMGEYPQFPSPFEPPTNYCDAYTAGPHPHFAPFTSPSQVPADLLTSPHWEVGFVLHAMEIRLPLHDHEFLAMQLRPVVVKVYGCVDSTFMRCAVVTDRASLVKRGAPGVPPAVLADLGPGDRRPFVHDNINVFDPFDRGVKTPAFGMQFSMVRFPYGYTMMGLRLDQLTVGLFSDPDVLAFVVEFFSTYFYDSEYGYPWPLPDAIAPHVGVSGEYGLVDGVDDDDDAGVAKEMLLLELVYSEVIVVHTPCLVLTANDRVFQIQSAGSSAGFGWQLFYEWTATDASLWVHLPGVEAHFIDSNKTTTAPSLLSTSKPATTGTPRTVLTPVTIDSTYAFNMLTWQQSSTFNVTRYDVAFPHEDDLTVFVYCVPSDIAFFAALVAAYETSLGDSSPSAPAPPASTPDGSPDDIEIDGEQVGDDEDETAGASCQEAWTSWSVHLPRKVGIVLLDDMLLFQKPVLQLVLCEVGLHVLQCHDDVDTLKDGDSYHHANDPQTHEGDIDNDPSSLAIASTLAVFAKLSSSAQVDVFNNIVRAWEPLVEPFHVKVLFEHNGSRIGVSITTPDSVQINITESFVNAVLESWGPQPRASVGLVNWTGKSVRYFQPQPLPHPYDLPLPASADPADGAPTPHRPLMVTYVRHPPLNPARGGSKADGTPTALACPPILSVLVGRHKVETTVLNQNDLDVLFASVHQHSHHTDAFRLALCGDATAELTYDMSVQLFGFQWLHHLDLNQSGYFFFDLVPEIPHVTMTSPPLALSSSPRGGQRALPSDAARTPMNESSAAVPLSHLLEPTAAVRAALRCLVHVDKTRWGHCVTLQSLFQVKNLTSFALSIALHATPKLRQDAKAPSNASSATIQLPPGEIHHVPLQPLYEHAAKSRGKHVGFLNVSLPSSTSMDGIHLLDLIRPASSDAHRNFIHTCQPNTYLCVQVTSSFGHATKKGRWSRLFRPTFSSPHIDDVKQGPALLDASQLTTLTLHPPLTLQNLLCVNIVCCVFRHLSGVRDVVWEGTIKAGGLASIYASNLADNLYCSVLLPALQCETVKPALLHVPSGSKIKVDSVIAFADKTNNTQPLKLKVENSVGCGGQRGVVLYAAYWLVNLTPFALQYKQDTRHFEVAGSAAALARRHAIDDDDHNKQKSMWMALAAELELQAYLQPPTADKEKPPPSATSPFCMDGRCSFATDSHDVCYCAAPTCAARRLGRFATMFSFGGGGNTVGFEDTVTAAFTNSLCIKCPKYTWSKGMSLEVLGVDQAVELKNPSHVLDLGVKIVPGPEQFYRTKCVIFTPRYLVLNQLPTALALYDGFHRLNTVLPPHDMQPFVGNRKIPSRRRCRARVQYLSTHRIHESSGKFSLDVVGPTDLSLVANTTKPPSPPSSPPTAGKSGATAPVATPKVPPTSLMADHTMAPLNLVRVHTRMCGPTYVTLLRQVTRIEDVSYRIDNQTASHVLYYRQVGVESPTNGWKQLAPGKSTVYVWAEPLALHQLAVCLRHEDAATRPSPRHIWTTRATKLNALLLSARKQQPHNETTMLHLGGGYVPTNAQSRQKHYYYQQAKQFGYASALVSERKGLGLDDVESIHLDVIGLQMALNRPSPTTTASSIGTNLHSFPPTSTDAPPSDVVSKPFLPKLPKRTTSCARIDNDGVTRVLRVRDTTSLDDEKRTFVHEEARVQRLLLQLLALQSGAAFATVHTSSRRARRDMSPSWEESSPRSSTVRGGGGQHCRRTATDCVSLRAFASSLHNPPPPMNTIPTSSDRNTRHTISRSLRTSSCVVDTNRSNPSAKRGGPVGPDSSSNSSRSRSGEGRVGLTLFQSMDHPTETTTTNNAEQALYEQMVSFMTSPVLEDVQQVLVQVVCASGLKAPASEGGGWSNPYGIVTLLPSTTSSPPHGQPSAHTTEGRGRFAAMASSKLSSSMLKRMEQKTYYIERTLDPVWRDQAFLFEKASAESACSIQIDIRSHSPLGKHVFLGRAVVEVGGDDDDNITKHVTVKLAGAKSHHVVTGTVGVVVQMARTRTQLLEYWYQRLRERMQVLSEQLVYIRSRLRQIDKERALEQKRKLNVAVEHHHAKQQAGRAKAKALLLENKAKLVAQKNKLKDKWTQQLQQLQHPSVHMNEKFAHFRDAAEKRWMSEVKKLHKANVRTSILHVKRLFAKESHASSATATSSTGTATKDHGGLSYKASLHRLRSNHVNHAKPPVATSHVDHVTDIKRCYHRLIRSGGHVVVGVLEGRHFGGLGFDKVHCVLVCQDTTIITPKAKADDIIVWPATTAISSAIPKIPLRRHRGDLLIHVVSTTKRSSSGRIIGQVRVPMDVALDYCGSHGGTFCAWFPVTPLADTSPVELDLVKLLQPVEMKLGYASPPSSSPCVQVTMTYEPEQSSFVLGRLQSYVSVFVGELAVSLSAPVPVLDTSSPPNHSNSVVEAHEILRISCSGIEVKCLTSSKQCQWTIDMDSFQVDNQRNEALNQTELPVMVSRTISSCSTSSTHDMTSAKALKPVLQAVVVTRRLEQTTSDSHGPGSPGGRRIGEAARHMTHIELVALSIEETDWTFDEVILRTLYDVCERLYEKHQPLFGGGGEGATSTPLSVAPSSPPLSTGFSTTSTFPTSSVYIACLEVRPFKCNITFRKSTTYALNTSSTSSSSSSLAMPNLKSKFLHSFLAAVLNIANTIENAPLEFNALRLDHEITDLHHLQDLVFQHYSTNILRQLYKLIGSMNFMGNPVGLAANVAGGVRDFVVQPYAGLTSGGGTGFVRGLTKGTASLLGHTTFGLFDTTSRMTGAMGNSVAAFSGDRVFKAKRNVYALARPTSRRDQLRLDVKKLKHDVFSGIVGGLTGLVMDPIRGGRRGGWRGLVGGVAQGFTGVVVKPVVGAMDFATHMVEGVRDVAGLAFETKQKAFDKHRKRMSHVFGADGRLLPHDAAGIWSTAVVGYLQGMTGGLRHRHSTTGPRKVTDVEPPMQIVYATAFKTAVGQRSWSARQRPR
ncbi:hypothetical protein, variant 1 [Aphanomyces astaci]|uniref:C2 domain-containing protein n=1 Tax=Aphanomyces astaci TaxID=112090 RepID=W4G865_APHAT|nr:hypothetical protein, variant 1 [Aphanomyces astaci]ETV75481.1 hypothetical protein, variant 1 [Aphanomyces astaci]|eukprot:XP_009835115.1 hypothetical protein, variant 1 [Aphanomyces astaci]